MRDPARIPMILAAIEREWREQPDTRLGQLLTNKVYNADLFNIEDGDLLEALGPQTDEERAYVDTEPEARRRGFERFLDRFDL